MNLSVMERLCPQHGPLCSGLVGRGAYCCCADLHAVTSGAAPVLGPAVDANARPRWTPEEAARLELYGPCPSCGGSRYREAWSVRGFLVWQVRCERCDDPPT